MGKNFKFSFLILHYQTIEDTIECVESIFNNIEYDNYNIVIVDNGSPNKSGIELKQKYKNNKKIMVLINEKNLGFAKGNNIGFKYIKNNENSDFIVMINNDTIIKQKDFLNKVISVYKNERFHVLGPKIISLVDNKNQNPQNVLYKNKSDVIKAIKKFKILYFLNLILLDNFIRLVYKNFLKKSLNKEKKFLGEKKDQKLHGSCLIFSKDYIEKYDGLYDKTFMYAEEDILYFITKRDNLKMIYNPEIVIYHKEDSATNSILKKDYLKRRFIYKNHIKSLKELLKLMEEAEK
ncbi:hypothetical protein LN42_06480 [Marinitoga sp. 1137]|uniref:glycosyltransferase n=1 Tax=Marinitoga sp. 1137 TaxID=1545835 RepID=UPI000950899E|nr:glycosyltransferase [Marinitoga sp. 1137]APT76066.1 hypothetical protein LN42_06480 [Marinitoga sp. 1137]